MGATSHVTTNVGATHVILKTTTRTRTLKGGGFGLTFILESRALDNRYNLWIRAKDPHNYIHGHNPWLKCEMALSPNSHRSWIRVYVYI